MTKRDPREAKFGKLRSEMLTAEVREVKIVEA